MKVLTICSGNAGYISPFVNEQAESIVELGIEVLIYPIVGKGIFGYLNNLHKIKKKIKQFSPDLLHAHYGLSGLVSSLQRTVPVIITFHGSDAYIGYVKILSKVAARLSTFNIFVEEKIKKRIGGHNKNEIIPCGIRLDVFYLMNKMATRELLGLEKSKKYILFASRFDNVVKNYPLAKKAVNNLNEEIEIIELNNKTREEVNLLLNACDLALLTSKSEGSPQFIKEAMACNCPIVATNVGDIREIISDTDGCYITTFEPEDVAEKIKLALEFGKRTDGREKIKHLDNKLIAKKIIEIYKKVLG